MLEHLDNKRLIFVTGKGGVGKSTCTAALAEALAGRGRRVLIVETDAYSAISEILGAGDSRHKQVEIKPNLFAINLRSFDSLVATLTRYLPGEKLVRAVISNRVTRSFFDSAPSVGEFVLLDQILSLVEKSKPQWDHVVVDLPASGHAVTFLAVPQTLNGMMRNVGPIAKRAMEIHAAISNPRRSAMVAVCLAEEMPVNETLELSVNLVDALGRGLDMALVNMVHHQPVPEGAIDQFAKLAKTVDVELNPAGILMQEDVPSFKRWVAGIELARQWFARDQHYLKILHDRLTRVIELPMVYALSEREIVSTVATFLNKGEA